MKTHTKIAHYGSGCLKQIIGVKSVEKKNCPDEQLDLNLCQEDHILMSGIADENVRREKDLLM